jgi:hypothetical protein
MYITVHDGTQNGFVCRASLIFVPHCKSGDYHNPVNYENFEHWVLTKLLPDLEELSLTVMDNASYHSVLTEKPPTLVWRMDKIIAWLQENYFPRGSFQS